jgi:hypothetical protein
MPAPERKELLPHGSVASDREMRRLSSPEPTRKDPNLRVASARDGPRKFAYVALSRFAFAIDKTECRRSLSTCRDGPRTPTTTSTPRSRR